MREAHIVMKENFERAKWIPIFLLAVLLMVIYKTIDNFTQITSAISRFLWVISPLLYGILFAYFLYTPHRLIENLFRKVKVGFVSKRARGFSTFTVFVLLVVVLAIIGTFILPVLVTSVIDMINSIPAYISQILDFLDRIEEDSIWYSLNLADTLRSSSSNMLNQYVNPAIIEQAARSVISFAGELFSVILGLIVSLYMLLERERIQGFFRRLSCVLFKNEKLRNRINNYFSQVNKVLFTFIASKGLDSIINFVVVTSILLIFKVPYALLLGLIAGLFNFIPYLGSFIAVFFISVITLITGDLTKAIQVLIPLFIFQQMDGNFIEPRIMKSSLKISPILVINAVLAGGAYFGIIGMFLAVPFVVVIKYILLEYMSDTEAGKDKAE